MTYRLIRLVVLSLLPVLLVGCSAPKEAPKPDDAHTAVAIRFLKSIEADKIFMMGLQRKLEKERQTNPGGMTDLMERVFSDIQPQEIYDLAAPIYANHLSQQHLTEITQFTEGPTGGRFFKLLFGSLLSGGPSVDKKTIMSQFNADELTEIMQFAVSESFVALKKVQPVINSEMKEAGRKLGETKMREYLKRN